MLPSVQIPAFVWESRGRPSRSISPARYASIPLLQVMNILFVCIYLPFIYTASLRTGPDGIHPLSPSLSSTSHGL
jgi:hypothetical protein